MNLFNWNFNFKKANFEVSAFKIWQMYKSPFFISIQMIKWKKEMFLQLDLTHAIVDTEIYINKKTSKYKKSKYF